MFCNGRPVELVRTARADANGNVAANFSCRSTLCVRLVILVLLLAGVTRFVAAQDIDLGERAGRARFNRNGNGNGHHRGKNNPPAPDPNWKGVGGSVATPTSGSWNTPNNTANWDAALTLTGAPVSFGGSGSSAYISTNDIAADSFRLSTVNLNSTASVTETIAGNAFDLNASSISQDNSGAFTISNDLDNKIFGSSTTLTLQGSGSGLVTLSGVISEKNNSKTVSLIKNGTSTFALSGNNMYTGTTAVNGGTLLVNGNQSAATGIVTVSNTGSVVGVLGGNGTIGGLVNITGTGVINAGPKGTDGTSSSVGATPLTTGALTLASTATFHADAFGVATNQWDKVVVNGAATLGSSTFQLVIASGLTFVPNTTYTLIDATSISGTFAGITDGSTQTFSGYTFIAHYNLGGDGNFELTVVPEPATWLAGSLAVTVLLSIQWRRLRRFILRG